MNNLKNPVMLARRLEAAEQMAQRQVALNAAAAEKLIRLEEERANLGSYLILLLRALGGRFEVSKEDLAIVASEGRRIHYSYPTPERPTFLMVLSAGGPAAAPMDETRAREELAGAGLSDEEVEALARDGKLIEAAQILAESVARSSAVNPAAEDQGPVLVHRDDGQGFRKPEES